MIWRMPSFGCATPTRRCPPPSKACRPPSPGALISGQVDECSAASLHSDTVWPRHQVLTTCCTAPYLLHPRRAVSELCGNLAAATTAALKGPQLQASTHMQELSGLLHIILALHSCHRLDLNESDWVRALSATGTRRCRRVAGAAIARPQCFHRTVAGPSPTAFLYPNYAPLLPACLPACPQLCCWRFCHGS